MSDTRTGSRKRPVNLTIDEGLVAQAKAYTDNLSATTEALLAGYVAERQRANLDRQQRADACAADWNAMHLAKGSFADEHSSL